MFKPLDSSLFHPIHLDTDMLFFEMFDYNHPDGRPDVPRFLGSASLSPKQLLGQPNGFNAAHKEVELTLSHNAGKLKVVVYWTGVIP